MISDRLIEAVAAFGRCSHRIDQAGLLDRLERLDPQLPAPELKVRIRFLAERELADDLHAKRVRQKLNSFVPRVATILKQQPQPTT